MEHPPDRLQTGFRALLDVLHTQSRANGAPLQRSESAQSGRPHAATRADALRSLLDTSNTEAVTQPRLMLAMLITLPVSPSARRASLASSYRCLYTPQTGSPSVSADIVLMKLDMILPPALSSEMLTRGAGYIHPRLDVGSCDMVAGEDHALQYHRPTFAALFQFRNRSGTRPAKQRRPAQRWCIHLVTEFQRRVPRREFRASGGPRITRQSQPQYGLRPDAVRLAPRRPVG